MSRARVLLLWPDFGEELYRQTPGRARRWGEVEFTSDPASGPFDLVAVFEDTPLPLRVEARAALFLPGEPPDSRRYPRRFLRQFDGVLGTQQRRWPIPAVARPFAFNWHLGWRRGGPDPYWLDLDALRREQPHKTRLCSCIASAKTAFPGHVRRLRFAQAVQKSVAGIDLFGAGVNPIADKYDALAPYRFHIAIENSRVSGYWTEKLGDALLAWSLPIYHGDPAIARLLPEGAVVAIDIGNPRRAIRRIRDLLADPEEHTRRLPAIAEARTLLLERYNLFAALAEEAVRQTGERRWHEIRSQATSRNSGDRLLDLAWRGRRVVARNVAKALYRPKVGT